MGIGELASALVDLVLPGGCAGCGDHATPWCVRCAALLGELAWVRLPGGPPVLATGRYSGALRTALLRYKERGRRDLAGALAVRLGAALGESALGESALGEAAGEPAGGQGTWLVPAPSRPAAARARGGDHVLRLCRRLAAGRPDVHVARALRLTRHARDSVGLDAAERAANLRGRVRVRTRHLPPPGAAVLLVDDVVTTGATLRACRDALAAVGVRADVALVLCDATAHRDHELGAKSYPPAGDTQTSLDVFTQVGATRRTALSSGGHASYVARDPQ